MKDVKITVLDGAGKQISTIKPSSLEAGVNRVVWDMRYDRRCRKCKRTSAKREGILELESHYAR